MIITQKHQDVYDNFYIDEPNANTTDFESFKYKTKITGETPDDDNKKDVQIGVPLKYLSNLWRTLEMPLINCEINPGLTFSKNVSFLLQLQNQNLE